MKTNIFKGTGVALVTPFKTDFSVDIEALVRIVNHVIDNRADFLVDSVIVRFIIKKEYSRL